MRQPRIPQSLKNLDIQNISDDELFNLIAKTLEPRFEINNNNKEVYRQLQFYFANDQQFNGDLSKGLLLVGGYGTGKTLAFEIFDIFNMMVKTRRTFYFFDSDEIIDSFTKNGRSSIEQYNREHDIAIDDLGEDSGKHYHFGSVEDPIDVLLSRRYKMLKDFHYRTFTTSNLDLAMMEQRFSGKVFDRMFEMFNTMSLVGNSWRRR